MVFILRLNQDFENPEILEATTYRSRSIDSEDRFRS